MKNENKNIGIKDLLFVKISVISICMVLKNATQKTLAFTKYSTKIPFWHKFIGSNLAH